MSCPSAPPTFRLLDAYVGWEVAAVPNAARNLVGMDDPAGVRLAPLNDDAVTPGDVDGWIPPPRLTRGCGPCEWYLVSPAPARLLRFDPCHPACWVDVDATRCGPDMLVDPVAVAARGRRVSVADPGAQRVLILSHGGERVENTVPFGSPAALAFTPCGELLVVAPADDSNHQPLILRFGAGGDARGVFGAPVPAGTGPVERIAAADDCTVFLVTRGQGGTVELWKARRDDAAFSPATLDDLRRALPPTGIVASNDLGFCWRRQARNGSAVACCWSWYGRPLCDDDVPRPPRTHFHKRGQLLTSAIDSGIPRCRWHRVRVDADVPSGTTLSVTIATSDDADAGPQPAEDPAWVGFPPGVPHALDWQPVAAGASDFLIDQPPGRWLFLRIRLTGDGTGTPVVRRIRIDMPRVTSAEFLPAVYRETPEAEDFTERFVALFDSAVEDLDAAVERYPALLDPAGAPGEVLPWVGRLFDLTFDPAWDEPRRRRILRSMPSLYRWRGTRRGLSRAVRLVFGMRPVIQELPAGRMWASLGAGESSAHHCRCDESFASSAAVVGSVRLFGRSKARLRLGSSPLGSTPVLSYGNPDQDPLLALAYRFRVMLPPHPLTRGEAARQRLRQLVDAQKPGHTIATLRAGGGGATGGAFVLGTGSAVGVDTGLGALPAPVLGGGGTDLGNIRLRRSSVLAPGRSGPRGGMVLGEAPAVGVTTVLQ